MRSAAIAVAKGTHRMGIIIRGLLVLGGIVAEWFISADSPNFGVVQGILAIAVFAAIVGIIAFWPRRAR